MTFYYVILTGKLIQMLWFGPLRTIEVEHLYDRSWLAILDTCLALTIFRDGFDLLFVLRFGSLLFCKTFHWIIGDRVDFVSHICCRSYFRVQIAMGLKEARLTTDGTRNGFVLAVPYPDGVHHGRVFSNRYIPTRIGNQPHQCGGPYNAHRLWLRGLRLS